MQVVNQSSTAWNPSYDHYKQNSSPNIKNVVMSYGSNNVCRLSTVDLKILFDFFFGGKRACSRVAKY